MYPTEVSTHTLNDILDLELLASYINQLYRYIKMPITLLDSEGNIIIASPWSEVCTAFMRKGCRTGVICQSVCTNMSTQKVRLFKCPNGFYMYQFPIVMGDTVIAQLVLSQFLFESPEREAFRKVAEGQQFDMDAFYSALDKIRMTTHVEIKSIIALMGDLVKMLHDMIGRRITAKELEDELMQGYEELEASYQDVSELNDQLNKINLELSDKNRIVEQSERRYRVLIEHMRQGIFIFETDYGDASEAEDYRVIDMNPAMMQILKEMRETYDNLQTVQTETLPLMRFIKRYLSAVDKESKYFLDEAHKKYYEVEYERLTKCEMMVCVTDKTEIFEKFENQRKQMWELVSSMGKLVEKRDLYTADHQKKVAALAARIAVNMGLSRWQVESVYLASLVHDIGKVSIPSEILVKPDKLTSIEYELMKTHVMTAYDILSSVYFSTPIAEIVKQHHERLDGSGYPAGLKGEALMIEARIVAVADVYEAINSHRPYRPSLGKAYALEHLNTHKGSLYDCDAVDVCTRIASLTPWTLDDVEKYFQERAFSLDESEL
ncbi:PocR ligand-binding domain-containing protein [Fusibacter paucivorans]|uniref:PocR ligand-binding domain-containing protein n=1 Tax=Fusibacter paucivorans TaxID=76009 RepID=A0ABS5PNM0_9FIRM|nr:HD domain-containing phosphohydrolase [Fusibacter paucivorans]MBS7526171.1 PocR ligand-binding domain-containing protein [Fusibacter paucivorans]